jgi:hypothetical protein
MITRITRRIRAWWHRRDVAWLLDYLGLTNLDELDTFLKEPVTPAQERWFATRARIMIQRNLVQLIQEAIDNERSCRVIDAVLDGG